MRWSQDHRVGGVVVEKKVLYLVRWMVEKKVYYSVERMVGQLVASIHMSLCLPKWFLVLPHLCVYIHFDQSDSRDDPP